MQGAQVVGCFASGVRIRSVLYLRTRTLSIVEGDAATVPIVLHYGGFGAVLHVKSENWLLNVSASADNNAEYEGYRDEQ